jgi:hypothetical protein
LCYKFRTNGFMQRERDCGWFHRLRGRGLKDNTKIFFISYFEMLQGLKNDEHSVICSSLRLLRRSFTHQEWQNGRPAIGHFRAFWTTVLHGGTYSCSHHSAFVISCLERWPPMTSLVGEKDFAGMKNVHHQKCCDTVHAIMLKAHKLDLQC